MLRPEAFPNDPMAVASELADLRSALGDESDPTMPALLELADALVDRWGESQRRVEERWNEYQAALGREGSVRSQLGTVLRSLVDLATDGHSPPVPQSPSVQQGRGSVVVDDGQEPESPGPATVAVASDASADHGRAPGGAEVAIYALGEFRFLCRGRPIGDWHGSKTERLARLLATQPFRPLRRDLLIDRLWPDAEPETGRRYLHQTVYALRKTLAQQGGAGTDIVYCNDSYRLNSELSIWFDVAEFEACVAAGRQAEAEGRLMDAIDAFETGAALYRADFLSDNPYEDWAQPETERLRVVYLSSTNHVADLRMDRGDVDAALELSLRVLEIEPCDEVAHRRAIRCHAATGRRSSLTRQFESCAQALRSKLGLEPSPETAALYRSLITLEAPMLPAVGS